MPQTTIIVDTVASVVSPENPPLQPEMASFEPSPGADPTGQTVIFGGGTRARLDLGDVGTADTLAAARLESLPVLVELTESRGPESPEDPPAGGWLISHATIPILSSVLGLKRLESGDVRVRLRGSHGAHYLRPAHPRFDDLLSRLNDARDSGDAVAIAEANRHDIFEVRPFESPFGGVTSALTEFSTAAGLFLKPIDSVTGPSAADLYTYVKSLGCHPSSISTRCIPFRYPDDGCHARAHWICELLASKKSVTSGKVWLNADRADPEALYSVKTRNAPDDCEVQWLYHVAPVVSVGTSVRVLDPSLFDRDVSVAEWKNRQDKSGSISFTSARVYDRPTPGRQQSDPKFRGTRWWLAYCRQELRQRVKAEGPPPYC